MLYEPIIGLEIHVQLKTASKMFCACAAGGDDLEPNINICPVCTGQPGALPVTNAEAIRKGVLAGMALGCRVPPRAKFDRKNYFYPDLPKGYQISQYDLPICVGGALTIDIPAPKGARKTARIRITRAHLEEDAGKLMHTPDHKSSQVDYNRSGTPLLEIVTEPDLRSPLEAKTFLQELRRIMRTIGVSNADMEKGQMRCDANISLRGVIDDPEIEKEEVNALNPKTEVKNINSFRAVERALEYEIKRQTRLFEEGTPPRVQTTRGWDDAKQITLEQRNKEEAHDYRYFPEPDLPPLNLASIESDVQGTLPELPRAKRERFQTEYLVSPGDATLMTDDPALAKFTEQVFTELKSWIMDIPDLEGTEEERWEREGKKLSRLVSGWLLSKLAGLMVEKNKSWDDLGILPEDFAEFITLIHTNKISSAAAQTILADMLTTGRDPSHIMEERGLGQTESEEELAGMVGSIIDANPDQVAEYKKGKTQVLQFLLGVAMKQSEGRANPKVLTKLFKQKLS